MFHLSKDKIAVHERKALLLIPPMPHSDVYTSSTCPHRQFSMQIKLFVDIHPMLDINNGIGYCFTRYPAIFQQNYFTICFPSGVRPMMTYCALRSSHRHHHHKSAVISHLLCQRCTMKRGRGRCCKYVASVPFDATIL